MTPKKLQLSLLIIFGFFKLNAGCGGPYLIVNGSLRYPGSVMPYSYSFNSTESILLQGYTYGCDATITKIYLNDSLIFSPGKMHFNIRALPGNYKVYVYSAMVAALTNEFVFSIIDPLTVGITEQKESDQFLSIGPNPANEFITINSNHEIIQTVEIFNSVSQIVDSLSYNTSNLSFPLDKYPSGIYFIKIATLSGRTTMKKFIIQ